MFNGVQEFPATEGLDSVPAVKATFFGLKGFGVDGQARSWINQKEFS